MISINIDEGAPDILGEGKISLPVARVEVIENAAVAARFIAVGKKEIIIALCFEARIVIRIVSVAGRLESGVEIARIFGWRACGGQHRLGRRRRRTSFCGYNHSGVHVCGRCADWQDAR